MPVPLSHQAKIQSILQTAYRALHNHIEDVVHHRYYNVLHRNSFHALHLAWRHNRGNCVDLYDGSLLAIYETRKDHTNTPHQSHKTRQDQGNANISITSRKYQTRNPNRSQDDSRTCNVLFSCCHKR